MLWACWAILRLRDAFNTATKPSRGSSTDVERPLVAEGSDDLRIEQGGTAPHVMGFNAALWRDTSQVDWPRPSSRAYRDCADISSGFKHPTASRKSCNTSSAEVTDSLGIGTCVNRDLSREWRSVSAVEVSMRAVNDSSNRSPTDLKAGGGNSRESTAPTSPESDVERSRRIKREGAPVSNRPARITNHMLGFVGSCCGLCGHTLEDGHVVSRSPECEEGIMVSQGRFFDAP